ncbi:unnamed protein product [Lepeophtheirus salmonis]|uniref:(salmon louse) hypothetical protein n=1 Tax=Lepeophtheirus salmonis TaxID=72036 RepID=A0A7R8H9Y2_LEPSM|nr:unnamed protein product [Lepeophtheirus salmonis]CAF2968099.1 unnamed protein product [Lepeophtheirus salmonis]
MRLLHCFESIRCYFEESLQELTDELKDVSPDLKRIEDWDECICLEIEQSMKFYPEFDTNGDQDLYSKHPREIRELQKRHRKTIKASLNFARELKINNLKTEIKYQKELLDIKKGFSSPIEKTKIETNEPLPMLRVSKLECPKIGKHNEPFTKLTKLGGVIIRNVSLPFNSHYACVSHTSIKLEVSSCSKFWKLEEIGTSNKKHTSKNDSKAEEVFRSKVRMTDNDHIEAPFTFDG